MARDGEARKLDEQDWGAFQLMTAAGLVKMATGQVNALKVACEELASRGLGERGEWIGFDAAARLWLGEERR
jgi:hypothetical protein